MRGRKPKPTELKRLQGNPGGRALNKHEPKPALEAPTAPSHLDAGAKREWRRIVPLLVKLRLLSKIDRAALAIYCQAVSRMEMAQKKIAEEGEVTTAPSGYPVQSPYLAIYNKAAEQVVKIAAEFGLTPSSRSRISVPGAESGPAPGEDELAKARSRRNASRKTA